MITIIDYGFGNLFSVQNALSHLGIPSIISHQKKDIEKASGLILPGVGAFRDGMEGLKKRDLIGILNEQVLEKKKKIIGLCLGMQLMAENSVEGGNYQGLGWIKGTVKRLEPQDSTIKIPHIGWNDVKIVRKDELMKQYTATPVFYFVHSYHVVVYDKKLVTGICTYGEEFVATLQQDTIYGAQFHPEKSQQDGLNLLKRFYELVEHTSESL